MLEEGEYRGSEFVHSRDGSLMRDQVSPVVGVDADAQNLDAHP